MALDLGQHGCSAPTRLPLKGEEKTEGGGEDLVRLHDPVPPLL
jgi:hypothetical protein